MGGEESSGAVPKESPKPYCRLDIQKKINQYYDVEKTIFKICICERQVRLILLIPFYQIYALKYKCLFSIFVFFVDSVVPTFVSNAPYRRKGFSTMGAMGGPTPKTSLPVLAKQESSRRIRTSVQARRGSILNYNFEFSKQFLWK